MSHESAFERALASLAAWQRRVSFDSFGGQRRLSRKDYKAAAKRLDVSPERIQAVVEVEAPGGFWLRDGRVKILFERHLFRRFTDGVYDASSPDLSMSNSSPYGSYALQHQRLEEASALDWSAAHRACSWGAFQVLGDHWERLGYASLEEFVRKMKSGAREHLEVFVRYVESNELAEALRDGHLDGFHRFARGYNGRSYARHGYHDRIATASRRLEGDASS